MREIVVGGIHQSGTLSNPAIPVPVHILQTCSCAHPANLPLCTPCEICAWRAVHVGAAMPAPFRPCWEVLSVAARLLLPLYWL